VKRIGERIGQRPAAPVHEPDWIETEQSVVRGLGAELSRMVRRARRRWMLVLFATVGLTFGLTTFVAKKPAQYEARITLALLEGNMSRRQTFLPAADLRSYVVTVLMSGPRLLEIIEQKNWYPLRVRKGFQYALSELMEQTDVRVERNYFLYEEDDTPRSARIEIEVADSNPDRAYEIADAVASVIVETTVQQGRLSATRVAAEVKLVQKELRKRLATLSQREFTVSNEMLAATSRGDRGTMARLNVELSGLGKAIANVQLDLTTTSQAGTMEALSQEISEAGQDVTIRRVAEDKPSPAGSRGKILVIIGFVVFWAMLGIVILVVGAFDNRIHDINDLRRLGLPVAGHLPPFPGDHVGAFKSRGNASARVPLLKLWR
jgi:hypothetical protein